MNDPAADPPLQGLWDRSRPLRLAVIVGLPTAVFALICGALIASQTHVARILTVYGVPSVLRGATAAMRFQLSDGVVPIGDYSMRVLDSGGRLLGEDRAFPSGCAAVTFAVPFDLAPGPHVLRVEALTDGDVVHADVPVEVVEAPGPTPPPPRDPPDPERYEEVDAATAAAMEASPVRLELFPDGRVFVSSIDSRIYVRATDKTGKPLHLGLEIELTEGEVGEIDLPRFTDAAGLAELRVYSLLDRLAFELRGVPVVPISETRPAGEEGSESMPAGAPDADGSESAIHDPGNGHRKEGLPPGLGASAAPPITVRLKDRPARAVLHTRTSVTAPGAAVELATNTIVERGLVFIDVFQGDLWLTTAAVPIDGGWAVMSQDLPAAAGLYTMQATAGLIATCGPPDRGAAVRTVLARPGGPGAPSTDDTASVPSEEDLLEVVAALEAEGLHDDYLEAVGDALRAGTLGRPSEDYDPELLARHLLDRAPGGVIHSPALLVNTQARDEARVAAFQSTVRKWLLVTGIGVGLIFAFGVVMFYRSGASALRRRWDALGEDAQPEVLVHPAKLEFVYIALVVLAALAALAALLATITWQL